MKGAAGAVRNIDDFDNLVETLASSQIPFWTQEGTSAAAFSSLVTGLLQVVASAAHRTGEAGDLSALIIAISSEPDRADDFGVQGREKIVVGERVLARLNRSITAYTAYLVYNFRFQTAPAIGPQPHYHELLQPVAFADRAAQMYARSYLPRTATEDGFVRSDFENLMTTLSASIHPDHSTERQRDATALPFSFPKPPMDIRIFFSREFKEHEAIAAYIGEEAQHRRLLHARMLCGVLAFAIAHEIAHVRLGHTEQQASSPAGARRDEFLADELAYSILESIEGYDLGALPVLFSFIQNVDNVSEDASHPLSTVRLRALYEQHLKRNGSPLARGEVTAALSLLASVVDPVRYRLDLGGDRFEDITMTCAYYQDPNFNVNLYLYLQRKPILGDFEGVTETNAILDGPAIRVIMTIIEGDGPGDEVCKAVSICHREKSSYGMNYGTTTGEVIARRDIQIRMPPELWLNRPNIQVRIDSVDITDAPPEPGCSFGVDRELGIPEFKLAAIDEMHLLLAARLYSEIGDVERALPLFEHTLARSPAKMEYTDYIALCTIYADRRQFVDLERLARACLAKPEIRPGFRYFLALAREGQGDISEALEHAFQEMFGMGEYGAFHEKAGKLFSGILKEPRGNWIDHMRMYYGLTMAANGLPWWKRWLAVGYHVEAYKEIRLAEEALGLPYLCVREIRYETELTICELGYMSLASAKAGFESIVAQQPEFVPSYIQLARIETLSGNAETARQWWMRAKEIVPSHNFVLGYRREIVPRIPLTSTRTTGPIRSWLGRRALHGKSFRFGAIVVLQFISWFLRSGKDLKARFGP